MVTAKPARAVVFHSGYGCETGCCGHVVQLGDDERFFFDHPYGQTVREFVRETVTEAFGAEHVADIDWDACHIVDD